MSIVGRTYLERGESVTVLIQWRGHRMFSDPPHYIADAQLSRWPVRNVLIRRANGDLVVRPFRGLRRAP